MPSKTSKAECEDFINEFFNRVITRLNLTADSFTRFTKPSFEVKPYKTEEQEGRYQKLLIKQYNGSLLKFEEKELIELFNLPSRDLPGFQIHNKIVMNQQMLDYPINYNFLSHEILHAVRKHLHPYERHIGYDYPLILVNSEVNMLSGKGYLPANTTNVNVPAEFIEFFAFLNSIIVPEVFSDRKDILDRFEKIDKHFSHKSVKKSFDFFNRKVFKRVDELSKYIVPLVKEIEVAKDIRYFHELDKWERFENYYRKFSSSGSYFSLIFGTPQFITNHLYNSLSSTMADIISIKNKTGFTEQKNITNKLADIKQILVDNHFLSKHYDLHLVAKLMVFQNQEKLSTDWPNVFLASANEVMNQYVNPTNKFLNKLRKKVRFT